MAEGEEPGTSGGSVGVRVSEGSAGSPNEHPKLVPGPSLGFQVQQPIPVPVLLGMWIWNQTPELRLVGSW